MEQNDANNVLISTLSQRNNAEISKRIKEYVTHLSTATQKPDFVANSLTTLLVLLREETERRDDSKSLELLNSYELIAKGLRNDAQKNEALKYFYYGVFQASVDEIVKKKKDEIDNTEMLDLLSQKHTGVILTFLYNEKECYQSQLSKALNMDRSNLYRIMQKLIKANLVEQRKSSKFCFYTLSAQGKQKYAEKEKAVHHKKPMVKFSSLDKYQNYEIMYLDKTDDLDEWMPISVTNKINLMPLKFGGKRDVR